MLVVAQFVDRLLHQLQEAGITKTKGDDPVSDDEKRELLEFLRQSQAEIMSSPVV